MAAIPPNAVKLVETISKKEEIFEKWRNTIGLFLGPLLALAVYLTDMPSLSPKAHTMAAILSWIVVWWICEPIPLPMSALLSSVLCVVFGVADAKTVFAPLCRSDHLPVPGQFHARRGDGHSWFGQTLCLRHHVPEVCRQQHSSHPVGLRIYLCFPVNVDQQHGIYSNDVSHCPGHCLRHGRHHSQADGHTG